MVKQPDRKKVEKIVSLNSKEEQLKLIYGWVVNRNINFFNFRYLLMVVENSEKERKGESYGV